MCEYHSPPSRLRVSSLAGIFIRVGMQLQEQLSAAVVQGDEAEVGILLGRTDKAQFIDYQNFLVVR